MEHQILSSLATINSTWDLLRDIPLEITNWEMILTNLTPLFRKNTFFDLVGTCNYYPQSTSNCRYYIKPNDGSCGKGIRIVNSLPNEPIQDHTICPEIVTPLISINNKKYKYDYRVWIAIKSNLTYFICPTLIKRISNIPFSLETDYGSLTNTALYSDQFDYKNNVLHDKINNIVSDILTKLLPIENSCLMLTGWDFIENESNDLFVLEVNPNPSINIQHTQVMTEFLNWIKIET